VPFQAAEDAIEVVCSGGMANGATWANVFHFRLAIANPLTQAVADAAGDNLFAFYDAFNNHLTTDWNCLQCVVTDLRVEGGPQYTADSGFPIAGGDAGAPLPNQTALVVTWRTATRGRSFRGRTYTGGWGEAASNGNSPNNTALTAIRGASEDLITAFGGALGVLSRVHDKDLRSEAILTEITASEVGAVWDEMRSRKQTEPL
jgi:hypothetical protein